MTGGALLGIKFIGSYSEHVVALDADPVENRTRDGLQLGRTLGNGRTAFGANRLGGHSPIVACGKRSSKLSASLSWTEASAYMWDATYVRVLVFIRMEGMFT